MLSRLIKFGLPILVLFLVLAGLFVVKTGSSEARTEVCFCHNVNHNPQTICTSNSGWIEGHMRHVNNGEDTLGSCPAPSPSPSPIPTPTPSTCPTDCQCPFCPPSPGGCNQTPGICGCQPGLEEYEGVCRNSDCPEEEDCVCPEPTPSPEPTPTTEVTPTPTPTTPPPSDGGDGGEGGPGEPWVCGASVPNTPTLLSATKAGGNADLAWTAVEQATHYALSYGLSSGNYLYGVGNTGKVTSFTIGELDPAVDYCFAVRAVNDCAPSGLSNEICTGRALGGQVLGVSTLGATGSFSDELFRILFIISNVCLGLGLKLFLPAKKAV